MRMNTDERCDALVNLLEIEFAEERERFEKEAPTLSLAERAARGWVVLDVESVDVAPAMAGRFHVTMARYDGQPLRADVGLGAWVLVQPRSGHTEDPMRAMVSRVGRQRLRLTFDEPPRYYVLRSRLRLEVMPNQVTFDRARRALQTLTKVEDRETQSLAERLFGEKKARFENPPEDWSGTEGLNPEQDEALQRAVLAQDYFLVHGPPGTGKSTVLGALAEKWVHHGKRVLATAASNAAVDHLLEVCHGRGLRCVRLGHPARLSDKIAEFSLDALVEKEPDWKIARDILEEAHEKLGYAYRQRKQGRSRERFEQARISKSEARELFKEARALEQRALKRIVDNAEVVCCTATALGGKTLAGHSFDAAIFDEATQCIAPLSVWPFLKSDVVVMAGDPQQLPPTVLSQKAARQGLAESLFETLIKRQSNEASVMLKEQYRMHPSIMSFASDQMYGGELRAADPTYHHTLAVHLGDVAAAIGPISFIDTAGRGFEEERPEGQESLCNPGEARGLLNWGRHLLELGLRPEDMAIVTPYRAQVLFLEEEMERDGRFDGVDVATVDAFQGREREVILLSLVRSNPEGELGFLKDLRRMNVALTRARRHLFVIGDSATIGTDPFYANFVDAMQRADAYLSIWEWTRFDDFD